MRAQNTNTAQTCPADPFVETAVSTREFPGTTTTFENQKLSVPALTSGINAYELSLCGSRYQNPGNEAHRTFQLRWRCLHTKQQVSPSTLLFCFLTLFLACTRCSIQWLPSERILHQDADFLPEYELSKPFSCGAPCSWLPKAQSETP